MHTRVGKSRSLAAAHWTASNLQQQLTACSSNLQPATTNYSSSSLQQQHCSSFRWLCSKVPNI